MTEHTKLRKLARNTANSSLRGGPPCKSRPLWRRFLPSHWLKAHKPRVSDSGQSQARGLSTIFTSRRKTAVIGGPRRYRERQNKQMLSGIAAVSDQAIPKQASNAVGAIGRPTLRTQACGIKIVIDRDCRAARDDARPNDYFELAPAP
jgi:hypothetical protein